MRLGEVTMILLDARDQIFQVCGLLTMTHQRRIASLHDSHIFETERRERAMVAPQQVFAGVDGNDIPLNHVPVAILFALLIEGIPASKVAPAHLYRDDGDVVRMLEYAVINRYVGQLPVKVGGGERGALRQAREI